MKKTERPLVHRVVRHEARADQNFDEKADITDFFKTQKDFVSDFLARERSEIEQKKTPTKSESSSVKKTYCGGSESNVCSDPVEDEVNQTRRMQMQVIGNLQSLQRREPEIKPMNNQGENSKKKAEKSIDVKATFKHDNLAANPLIKKIAKNPSYNHTTQQAKKFEVQKEKSFEKIEKTISSKPLEEITKKPKSHLVLNKVSCMAETQEKTPSTENNSKIGKTNGKPECSISVEKRKFVDSTKTFQITSPQTPKNNHENNLPKVCQASFVDSSVMEVTEVKKEEQADHDSSNKDLAKNATKELPTEESTMEKVMPKTTSQLLSVDQPKIEMTAKSETQSMVGELRVLMLANSNPFNKDEKPREQQTLTNEATTSTPPPVTTTLPTTAPSPLSITPSSATRPPIPPPPPPPPSSSPSTNYMNAKVSQEQSKVSTPANPPTSAPRPPPPPPPPPPSMSTKTSNKKGSQASGNLSLQASLQSKSTELQKSGERNPVSSVAVSVSQKSGNPSAGHALSFIDELKKKTMKKH